MNRRSAAVQVALGGEFRAVEDRLGAMTGPQGNHRGAGAVAVGPESHARHRTMIHGIGPALRRDNGRHAAAVEAQPALSHVQGRQGPHAADGHVQPQAAALGAAGLHDFRGDGKGRQIVPGDAGKKHQPEFLGGDPGFRQCRPQGRGPHGARLVIFPGMTHLRPALVVAHVGPGGGGHLAHRMGRRQVNAGPEDRQRLYHTHGGERFIR